MSKNFSNYLGEFPIEGVANAKKFQEKSFCEHFTTVLKDKFENGSFWSKNFDQSNAGKTEVFEH